MPAQAMQLGHVEKPGCRQGGEGHSQGAGAKVVEMALLCNATKFHFSQIFNYGVPPSVGLESLCPCMCAEGLEANEQPQRRSLHIYKNSYPSIHPFMLHMKFFKPATIDVPGNRVCLFVFSFKPSRVQTKHRLSWLPNTQTSATL